MAVSASGRGISIGALVVATVALIVGPLTAVVVPGPQGSVGLQGPPGSEGPRGPPGPIEDPFVIGHVVVGNCTGPDGTGPFHLRVHAVNVGDTTARNVTLNVTVFVAFHDTSTGSTHPHSRTYEYGPIGVGDMAPRVWRLEEVLFDGGDCNMNHSSVDAEAAFVWE